jgi:CheY-like chemotaxis protein
MPRKSGKEVLKEMRNMEGFEDVPIVLFSTSTLPSEAAFAKSFGAGFLTKPLHSNQITQLVDAMIAHCTDDVKKNIRKLKGK